MHIAILTILFTLFAILAWRNLKLALILLSGLLPIYLIRFDIGPIPSTALEILILICVIIWALRFKQWKKPGIEFKPWIRPTLLLIAAASFGVAVAPDTFSALGIWKAYFIEPILVAVMMITVFNRNDWTRVLQALSISAIAISLFAIFQYLTGIGIPTPWDIELRVTSFYDYPNAVGLFLAPIVAFNITALALRLPSFSRRGWGWLSLVSILLGLIAITLAKTEAALVAIPAAVIITLLISNISKKKKIALAIASAVLLITAFSIPTVRQKLTLQDYSGQVRISQWTETVELLKDKPIFGAGLNGYPTALEPYHDATLYEIFQYPHNIILNTWTELGLLGLITLAWFAWLILRAFGPPPFQGGARGGYQNKLKLAIFAALLTITIHGLVDAPYFKNDLAILTWIFLAIFTITTKQTKQP